MSGHEHHDHAGHDHAGHDHAGHDHAGHDHAGHDHSGHDHGFDTPPAAATQPAGGGRDHAGHDHADHAGHDHHDHSGHAGHDPLKFRKLFWICLALTVPAVVFSTGLQDILGLGGPRFPGSEWIPAVFGTAIVVIGGRIFLVGAWHELRAKSPGMMTLISLAIVVSFGYSLAVMLGLPGMDFWWELATLVTIMLLGHWIEMSAVHGAQNALGELAKLLPDQAEVLQGGEPLTVSRAELAVGDRVLVRPGAAIPADGEVVEGEAEVDESLLTGESVPVGKHPGDAVVAGSLASGSLTVRVTRTGGDTALAGIMRLVADAQASRSPAQLLADRAAALLFYVALGAALVTLAVWWLLRPDDPSFVLERVVAVLVIACPHALGLAIPLVAQLSTAIGARRGILIRSRSALEEAKDVDVVLFDKTGTLTAGRQTLARVVPAEGVDEADALALAAAVEARSEHPIGRAIVEGAREASAAVPTASGFRALPGRGAVATVDGRELAVASSRYVTERGIQLEHELVHAGRAAGSEGSTTVFLVEGAEGEEHVLALFAIADQVRPESADAVRALRADGVRVAMLTGDSHVVAQHVATELGITEVRAEVLPEQKAEVVASLQEGGAARVAMVGDGINDAPALARADLGIAIGAGTDVAIESAGVVLASSDPRGVADTITLSRASYRKMLQNLWWAAGYNAVGIPLAAGVLAGVGFLMPPALAAVLMSASTVIVALNAQLLRRIRFRR
ncbi:heavy metal translocating P-type ATPase [Protaetiibacter intestinalis]|uniref:Heavy metal translocating P-type ATPase n=1 Tax=Protaetiibacter intestinalis TaxID=2419774 RepID=A0A387B460_9MICO|nr:heavy metal translocating P-type ATPase [Protaetiibacter intestinalis]AYF97097.1 heavy metal translocating P-type ATPase [Protaetiibacter intestinalis]